MVVFESIKLLPQEGKTVHYSHSRLTLSAHMASAVTRTRAPLSFSNNDKTWVWAMLEAYDEASSKNGCVLPVVMIPAESDWGHLPQQVLRQLATTLPAAALETGLTICRHWLLPLAGLPQRARLARLPPFTAAMGAAQRSGLMQIVSREGMNSQHTDDGEVPGSALLSSLFTREVHELAAAAVADMMAACLYGFIRLGARYRCLQEVDFRDSLAVLSATDFAETRNRHGFVAMTQQPLPISVQNLIQALYPNTGLCCPNFPLYTSRQPRCLRMVYSPLLTI